MDRFKFRAWDTDWLRMRYEEDYVIVPDTGNPHWIHNQETIQREATQLILMQCTGLKYSTDQLIYEGDIVKLKRKAGWGTSSGQTEVVQWDSRKCRYTIGSSDLTDTKHLTVIGNIYETKIT